MQQNIPIDIEIQNLTGYGDIVAHIEAVPTPRKAGSGLPGLKIRVTLTKRVERTPEGIILPNSGAPTAVRKIL